MSEFTNLCGIVKDPEYVSNPEKKIKAEAILNSRLSIKSCSKQDRGPGIRIHKYINGAEQRLRNKPHFHSHLISIKGAKSIHRQKASNPEEKSKYSHRGKQAWLLPHSLFCCYNKIPEQRALTMNGSLLANSSVGWDIEEQSTRNCNCVCVCYFLSVLHTHPFPTHPSLCLPLSCPRHFFLKPSRPIHAPHISLVAWLSPGEWSTYHLRAFLLLYNMDTNITWREQAQSFGSLPPSFSFYFIMWMSQVPMVVWAESSICCLPRLLSP